MTTPVAQKDLVVLAADKNIEFAIRGLLSRRRSLGIRVIDYDLHVHPAHDPGCLRQCDSFLRSFSRSHRFAIVVFDREGCGREQLSRLELETEVEGCLDSSGWKNRAAAIVLDPELEIWVWSDSPHVDVVLGWADQEVDLRAWLSENAYWKRDDAKPHAPKDSLEAVLRKVRKPRSSALYQLLAQKVGLARCTDAAFVKLKATLRSWFST